MILEQFEQHMAQTDRSLSAKYYLADLRKFIRWFKKDILTASVSDLLEYQKYLQDFGGRRKTKAEATTVNRAQISLSLFFEWALAQKLVQVNPAEGIKHLKVTTLPEWLSKEEQAKFMHAVQAGSNLRDIAICSLMLYAGLGMSEVRFLKPNDILLKSGQIIIRPGKGRKQRTIPMDSHLRNILSNHIEQSGTVLFKSNKGGTLTPRGIQHMVKKYASQAGLENVTPRILCNSFRKNLIDNGMDLEKVAKQIGLSTPIALRKFTAKDDGNAPNAKNV